MDLSQCGQLTSGIRNRFRIDQKWSNGSIHGKKSCSQNRKHVVTKSKTPYVFEFGSIFSVIESIFSVIGSIFSDIGSIGFVFVNICFRNRKPMHPNSETNLLVPQRKQCFRCLEGIENNVNGACYKISIRASSSLHATSRSIPAPVNLAHLTELLMYI